MATTSFRKLKNIEKIKKKPNNFWLYTFGKLTDFGTVVSVFDKATRIWLHGDCNWIKKLFAVCVWTEYPKINWRVIKTTYTCVSVCAVKNARQAQRKRKEASKREVRTTATQPLLLRRRTAHVSTNKLRSTFAFVVKEEQEQQQRRILV